MVKFSGFLMAVLLAVTLLAGCAIKPSKTVTTGIDMMSTSTKLLVYAGTGAAVRSIGVDKILEARSVVEKLKAVATNTDAYLSVDDFESYAINLATETLRLLPSEQLVLRELTSKIKLAIRDGTQGTEPMRIRVVQVLAWMLEALPAINTGESPDTKWLQYSREGGRMWVYRNPAYG